MYNYNLYSYSNPFVDSIKEAETTPIDFSGNPTFFFNRKENEVYLKQFNLQTGKTFFGKYVFSPIVPEEQPKSELNTDILDSLKRLESKCDYLYGMLENSKENKPKREKGVKDDE